MAEYSLKQAISYIYDLGKNNYLMTRAIIRLDQQLEKTVVPTKIQGCPLKPRLRAQIRKPENNTVVSGVLGGVLSFLLCGCLSFVIAPYFYIIAVALMEVLAELLGALINARIEFDYVWMTIVIIAVYLAFVMLIVCGSVTLGACIGKRAYKKNLEKVEKENHKIKESNNLLTAEYEKAMIQYEARLNDVQERFKAHRNALYSQKDTLQKRLMKSRVLCYDLYETIGIDNDFRNLVPIGYMEEFLRLGIATRLEGDRQLYDRVRSDLREDEMKYTMKEIVYGIDRLINQNHRIYEQLTSINAQCDQMVANSAKEIELLSQQNELCKDSQKMLKEVEKNSALTQYHTSRIEKEERYRNYMDYIRK